MLLTVRKEDSANKGECGNSIALLGLFSSRLLGLITHWVQKLNVYLVEGKISSLSLNEVRFRSLECQITKRGRHLASWKEWQ